MVDDSPVDYHKHRPDQFLSDGYSQIDMVLAFEEVASKNAKNTQDEQIRDFFEKLLMQEEGLILERETSASTSEQLITFVKIHAPFDVLAVHAESMGLKIPLKGVEKPSLETEEPIQQKKRRCNPTSLPDEFLEIANERPTYAATFQRRKTTMFEPYNEFSFFQPTDRILIVWDILTHTQCEPGPIDTAKIGIERLLNRGIYLAAYPLHDGGVTLTKEKTRGIPLHVWNDRRLLRKFWANKCKWYKNQPLDLVRRYFGLQIAVYFAWLSCYTRALIPAAIVGLGCFIYGIVLATKDVPISELCDSEKIGNITMCPTCPMPACEEWNLSQSCTIYTVTKMFSNEASMVYVLFLIIWTVFFQISWKRTEAKLLWQWHDTTLERSVNIEPARLEYELSATELVKNPITDRQEPHVSGGMMFLFTAISTMASAILICFVIFSMVLTIFMRVHLMIELNEQFGEDQDFVIYDQRMDRLLAAFISASISTIFVVVFEKIYRKIAWYLTEFECPRTLSQFETSFTYKMIIFEFINCYGPLIYVGLVKSHFISEPIIQYKGELFNPEHCDPGGCMGELTVQLVVTMIEKPLLEALWNIFAPVATKLRMTKELVWKSENGKIRQWEKDFISTAAPPSPLVDEYLEMVIQYGFVAMFSIAFPLAPFLVLLNNLIEIRTDAYKWVVNYRRPIPVQERDIGPWFRVMNIISYLSLILNAALIGFTSDLIPRFIYSLDQPDSSLRGYVNDTLSVYRHNSTKSGFCSYVDYKEPYPTYARTTMWWHVLAARISFVLVFIVLGGALQRVINTLVPTVPFKVDLLMKREQYIIWQKFYHIDAWKKYQKSKSKSKSTGSSDSTSRLLSTLTGMFKKFVPD